MRNGCSGAMLYSGTSQRETRHRYSLRSRLVRFDTNVDMYFMSSAPGIEVNTDFEGCYSMVLANWCHEFVVANRYIVLSSINSERYGYV